MTDLPSIASETIARIINANAASHGEGSWEDEPLRFHCLKCIRHMTTGMLMACGLQEPDGENHFELALTRAAMALHVSGCAKARQRDNVEL